MIQEYEKVIVDNATTFIDSYIKYHRLASLEKVPICDLTRYYCASGENCYYYKEYLKHLQGFDSVPIYPAILSDTLFEKKTIWNNFYLFHTIMRDVDLGGRTCIECGNNMHTHCALTTQGLNKLNYKCYVCVNGKKNDTSVVNVSNSVLKREKVKSVAETTEVSFT